MTDKSGKRNRSGNFDQDDVELFLSLVNESKTLIESNKQEDKKKGWDLIHDGFNDNCTGIKRDVNALKMKLKNLKAHNKKIKFSDSSKLEQLDETQESEHDASIGETSMDQKPRIPRKRGKLFSTDECTLLQELVEKHFYCLDTSLTRDSLDMRHKAWETITDEFNKAQVNEIQRDTIELKTKHKNMKAQRSSFKTESETGNSLVDISYTETDPLPVDSMADRNLRSKDSSSGTRTVLHNDLLPSRPVRILRAPAAAPYQKKSYDAILDSLDPSCDYSDEDDFPRTTLPKLPAATSSDREVERIRKENLLLKNSVLRKKERLLEIQISLAERNLRRHQL